MANYQVPQPTSQLPDAEQFEAADFWPTAAQTCLQWKWDGGGGRYSSALKLRRSVSPFGFPPNAAEI
jgi:hypothetical protein